MINKLFNELILNSYKEEYSFRDTVRFMTLFQQRLVSVFSRGKTVFKVQAPIIFNEGSHQNENNFLLNEPKSIFLNGNNFLAELSEGARKWLRILATNLALQPNDILFATANSFILTNKIDPSNPSTNPELIITIPATNSDYSELKFATFTRKVYTMLINSIEKTFADLNLESNSIGSKISILNLNDIEYVDEASLEKEIVNKISNYNECVGIYQIPSEHYKNYFFHYDIYDVNFFLRVYGCNKFTNNLINLCEISLTVRDNIYNQCKVSRLAEYRESNYYANVSQQNMNNYYQIKFNLAKIYLFFLQKYTVNEVSSAPISSNDALNYKKKRISVF